MTQVTCSRWCALQGTYLSPDVQQELDAMILQ